MCHLTLICSSSVDNGATLFYVTFMEMEITIAAQHRVLAENMAALF